MLNVRLEIADSRLLSAYRKVAKGSRIASRDPMTSQS